MQSENPNASGNHRRNLVRSVEASSSAFVPIDRSLWVHAWDRHTPFEETMRALDDPSEAERSFTRDQRCALDRLGVQRVGRTPRMDRLVGLQIEYSLLERTVERTLPMARAFDLSVLMGPSPRRRRPDGKYTKPNADASASAPRPRPRPGPGPRKVPRRRVAEATSNIDQAARRPER